LKAWQIDELLADKTKHDLFLPESIANRMNMLFDLMELVYANSQVNENEIIYIKGILEAFQLPATVLDELIELFENGTPTSLQWRDFVDEICTSTAQSK